MEDYESQAKFFKALMHPARLAILDILRDGEQCVCHMEAALDLRQAYISQHLMILRESGLVHDRRDGWNIFYRVMKPEVFEIVDIAQRLNNNNGAARQHSLEPTNFKNNCPCPKCQPAVEHTSV